MCGIAGIIGKEKNKDELIRKMVDAIHHRGPDDDGYYSDETVAFGMRRLSIIDLQGGAQPIQNDAGNLSIIFNGEIYNYQKLHQELSEEGHHFKTKSDTEVILKLYEKLGPAMLTKLRGMFAFSIYDKDKKTLFIARDYFGIKPLYYLTKNTSVIAYGSEIKSLLLHPKYKREVNEDAVYNYLSYQYNPLEETMFKNIWKLPPGSYMMIDAKQGRVMEKKYWSYEFSEERNDSEKDLKYQVLEGLKDSVKAHMVSDVPVGGFLSGGIDSAIIIALMSKEAEASGKNVSTFTIGFKEVSEEKQAKVMSDHVGSDHHEFNVSFNDYLGELPKISWHFDEPVADPSAVGLYFLAREARKKVKVVLSGEGADELFGGYNIYREPIALAKLKLMPKFMLRSLVQPAAKSGMRFYGKNYLNRFFSPIEERYIGNANVFKKNEVRDLWQIKEGEEKIDSFSLLEEYKKMKHIPDSEKMQLIDINHWLPGDILQKADKMTMAHSLELRVPFLDVEIARISSTIPYKFKFKNGQTKYILRQAVKGLLPRETAKRKKLGFPTALKHWMRHNMESFEKGILENEYIKSRFKLGFIKHLIKEHKQGIRDNSRKIYLLYMLALWHRTFFEK